MECPWWVGCMAHAFRECHLHQLAASSFNQLDQGRCCYPRVLWYWWSPNTTALAFCHMTRHHQCMKFPMIKQWVLSLNMALSSIWRSFGPWRVGLRVNLGNESGYTGRHKGSAFSWRVIVTIISVAWASCKKKHQMCRLGPMVQYIATLNGS